MHVAWAPSVVAGDLRRMLRGGFPDSAALAALPDLEQAILTALRGGGSFLADRLHASLVASGTVVSVETLDNALWQLAKQGLLTCDSFSSLLARVTGKRPPQRRAANSRGARSRALRRTRLTPTGSGPRWALAPGIEDLFPGTDDDASPEQTAVEYAGLLLDRWGVVTRLAVTAEEPIGGFSGQYRVLATLAEAGTCQRIYAVEGAGGAQFALPGTVDQLRAVQADSDRRHDVVILAAVDPANPYGTVLPWPEGDEDQGTTLRPSRRAGALVVLRGSKLLAWLDPAGSKMLSWNTHDAESATDLLTALARGRGQLIPAATRATLTEVNGVSLLALKSGSEPNWGHAATAAGFASTPRGWRWPSYA